MRRPYVERKAALRKILRHDKLLAAACKLGLEGIVSKKLDAPYKSGPSEAWLKIKNPNAPAATRAIDGQTPTWPRHIAAPRGRNQCASLSLFESAPQVALKQTATWKVLLANEQVDRLPITQVAVGHMATNGRRASVREMDPMPFGQFADAPSDERLRGISISTVCRKRISTASGSDGLIAAS